MICRNCQKDAKEELVCEHCSAELIYPLWQRAMRDPEKDKRKYEEPFREECKWKAKRVRKSCAATQGSSNGSGFGGDQYRFFNKKSEGV